MKGEKKTSLTQGDCYRATEVQDFLVIEYYPLVDTVVSLLIFFCIIGRVSG